ncbi:hypothetical protein ONZ45_g1880 [Pleurotus djamor]|nr:hypothetical protein ONZ45_g1880 [Pleurotus djamor]
MAKKKKTQLKPLTRGFATTSVAKKIVPVEEQVQVVDDDPAVEESSTTEDLQPTPNALNAEEQSLQAIVDTNQEKIGKEINRTLKLIEQEKRFTQTFPELSVDPAFTNHVLDLAIEYNALESKPFLDESQDKVLVKLGVTYGVLRRLGFSESRVQACLGSIGGVGLEEAYDWLYLHCSEDELNQVTSSSDARPFSHTQTPSTPQAWTLNSQTPTTPQTPVNLLQTLPQSESTSTLNPNAPSFKPQASTKQLAELPSAHSFDITEIDDPNIEYARTRVKIQEAKRKGSHIDRDILQTLEFRAKRLSEHYFFNSKEAEALYRIEQAKVDAAALDARLRGLAVASVPPNTQNTQAKVSLPPPVVLPEPTEQRKDFFDEDDDEHAEGGILGILEALPESATDSNGTTVSIKDMALPKHWVGATPKVLLTDKVTKLDKYAIISWTSVSGVSRAKRAGLTIRWAGREVDNWSMTDVACHDDVQAQHYIATVALHALTYPPQSAGFIQDDLSSAVSSSIRALPPSFRDLWDSLNIDRKLTTDAHNRSIWASLQTILTTKMKASPPLASEARKEVQGGNGMRASSSLVKERQDVFSERLMHDFQMKQSTPSYLTMLTQRNTLPIASYRETIMETLESSQVLVLSGETGCGKSTQVPSFILESQLSQGKPCRILCTEPRRISAMSLAHRVSRELGEPANAVGTLSSLVGYSIRLESVTSRNTRLTFVTNGIALRMLEEGSGQGGQGTALDDITHIVIDEVHERTIESDFLLIVLKTLVRQRPDLKVVLMSATMESDKIAKYFDGCPILQVPGRTFPVGIRYLEDAIEWTKWTINEDSPYARSSHDRFYKGKGRADWSEDVTEAIDEDGEEMYHSKIKLGNRYSPQTTKTINLFDDRVIPYDLIVQLLERLCFEETEYLSFSSATLIFLPGIGEIRRLNDLLTAHPRFGGPEFYIHPLHSTLSSESQSAVFDIPPTGIRKIVLATNIAETGITIPDITCVIDTGKHREMRFDEKRQISRLIETFIAKSNAAQRRGRAGRVQNGLCFHLFTKVRHDTQMAPNPLPEIMRLSLSDLALRIKIMKIQIGTSIEDVLSKALDPPVAVNIQRAISSLVEVKALTTQEEITPMGKLLSKLPTDVHLGKFLLVATVFRCLDTALTIAATLNSKSPFVTPFGLEQEADRAKQSFRTENSDFLTIHNAFCSWRRASENPGFVRKFCRTNYLSHQNLQQIEELRQQFLGYLVDSRFVSVDPSFLNELNRARYSRGRTRFVFVPNELDVNSSNPFLVNAALVCGLYPKVLAVDATSGQMRTIANNQQASFHPSSVNFGKRPVDFGVNHLTYFTLMRSKKLYAWETGPVDDVALLLLCGEPDVKLIADSVSLDRKIRFKVSPKVNIALKVLRAQLANILSKQYRSKPLVESQILWYDLGLLVLGKVNMSKQERSIMIS